MESINFSDHDLLVEVPNGTYNCNKDLPAVKDPNPVDFIKAACDMEHIIRGRHFSINGFVNVRNKRWYKTNHGFINENALLGGVLYKV